MQRLWPSLLCLTISVSPLVMASTNDHTLDRATVTQHFRASIVEDMCESGSYFQTCFDNDQKTCTNAAQVALEKCLIEVPIPKKVVIDQLIDLGGKVGSCAGKHYFKKFKNKLGSAKQCQEPMTWAARQ